VVRILRRFRLSSVVTTAPDSESQTMRPLPLRLGGTLRKELAQCRAEPAQPLAFGADAPTPPQHQTPRGVAYSYSCSRPRLRCRAHAPSPFRGARRRVRRSPRSRRTIGLRNTSPHQPMRRNPKSRWGRVAIRTPASSLPVKDSTLQGVAPPCGCRKLRFWRQIGLFGLSGQVWQLTWGESVKSRSVALFEDEVWRRC
jgi:hypothetical protein